MNRSFRATESQMQAMKQRPQLGSMRRPMMKEKEEELAMFLEMKKREKERDNLLLQNAEEFDAPLGSKPGTSPIFNITSPPAARRTGTDDFLNADNDKNDYDWLLTPPGTPLFPSLEMDSHRTVMSQTGTPKARPTALKSRLANPQLEPPSRNNFSSRQSASSPGLNTSSGGLRRPASSGGPGSRPATPTGRPALTSSTKPTLTKTTSTIASRSASATVTRPARSSTPTRATLPSTKPTVPARSSTPTSRSTARSSTPTRSSAPPSRTTSRASTPTRRPGTPSSLTNTAAPPVKSSVPSLSRPGSASSRNPAPPRASSPTVKARVWNPSEMPGFSLDAPPNLRTSLADRPPSATRGRPGAPSSRSSSVEPVPNGRVRRQSCSPSRGRPPHGMMNSGGSSVPAVNRAYAKANEVVSPGMMGAKMVERVINMRKLMPPRVDDKHSPRSNLSGKSSSPDSTGFGRTLSKKSLDMAIRHMDIRRTLPGNLRPLMTNVPASSMYSVRSGHTRSRTVSVSDSPLATSSNASSDVSFNNNGLCLDGSEAEDDANSERGNRSPASVRGR